MVFDSAGGEPLAIRLTNPTPWKKFTVYRRVPASGTINVTLAQHLAGRSAEQISTARGLELTTIYGHFADAISASLVDAKDVLPLDAAQIDEITAAFETCQTLESGKLGPAHAALEGKYDYGILKCLLAELG